MSSEGPGAGAPAGATLKSRARRLTQYQRAFQFISSGSRRDAAGEDASVVPEQPRQKVRSGIEGAGKVQMQLPVPASGTLDAPSANIAPSAQFPQVMQPGRAFPAECSARESFGSQVARQNQVGISQTVDQDMIGLVRHDAPADLHAPMPPFVSGPQAAILNTLEPDVHVHRPMHPVMPGAAHPLDQRMVREHEQQQQQQQQMLLRQSADGHSTGRGSARHLDCFGVTDGLTHVRGELQPQVSLATVASNMYSLQPGRESPVPQQAKLLSSYGSGAQFPNRMDSTRSAEVFEMAVDQKQRRGAGGSIGAHSPMSMNAGGALSDARFDRSSSYTSGAEGSYVSGALSPGPPGPRLLHAASFRTDPGYSAGGEGSATNSGRLWSNASGNYLPTPDNQSEPYSSPRANSAFLPSFSEVYRLATPSVRSEDGTEQALLLNFGTSMNINAPSAYSLGSRTPSGTIGRGYQGPPRSLPPAGPSPQVGDSSSGNALGKKRRIKTFRKPQLSDFCHICGRTSKTQRMSACSNIRTGTCRKAVCRLCFETYGWDWMRAQDPVSGWPCCHCREECPPNSRCFVYQRANEKRKQKSVVLKADEPNRSSNSSRDKSAMMNGADDASSASAVPSALDNP
ncbi:hypothetical protein FVE85_4177 [Porphyridium purpureum]|uniref:Zinc-finger domain-containing protein n=1 Tax=Porphyridium purpureum TaxID=35688 RepID=A0A5J4YTN8_PORPP|nr:hypothetical protein FVE85_4177 [Porphyridium purpureum]|eukprot:POR0144..scf229_5